MLRVHPSRTCRAALCRRPGVLYESVSSFRIPGDERYFIVFLETSAVLLAASRAFPQLCQNLVHAEAACFLARREFLKRFEEFSDDGLRRHTNIGMVEPPVIIGVRRDVRLLIRIGPQVEELRKPQGSERFLPYQQSSLGALFGKNKFPVVVAQTDQVGVIIKVVELLARTLLRL